MEKPDRGRLVKSMLVLFLLGAVDADGYITELGRKMAQFQLEPQFARALLVAGELDCAGDALTLVSMLSTEGVFYRPSRTDKDQMCAASMAHRNLFDHMGDHTTLVRIYEEWKDNGCSAEWCKRNYLHQLALLQARNIRTQIHDQLNRVHVRLQDRVGILRTQC